VSLLKSLFATAMGFFLGMVLAGVGGLSAETLFNTFSHTENSKDPEAYWAATGLGFSDVEKFISNRRCKRFYEACLNSVIQNAPALKLKLLASSGQLVKDAESLNLSEEYTESELLSIYLSSTTLKKKINFDHALKMMFAQSPVGKQSALAGQMINSFFSAYIDPHTYIIPSLYYEQISAKIDRSKYFVGVSYFKRNGEFWVEKVAKNSDAELAGLKTSDKILAINGQRINKAPYSEVSKILRNQDTESFRLEIERAGAKKVIEIERSYRTLSHVQYSENISDKKIGIITLTKFSSGACTEISDILKRTKDLDGLVLDLRDNPGGRLNEVVCIAGLFIGKDKKAYYIEYINESRPNEVVLTSEDLVYRGPLAVAVNHRSASASEALAGTLQDFKRAAIIGRQTFGKGSFQEPIQWPMNPLFKLFSTEGRYLLPSRNGTQLVGIKPDFELPATATEIREKDIYINPMKPAARQYSGLKKHELVNNFDYKDCKDKGTAIEEDLYLQTSIGIINCSIARKTNLAQAQNNSPLN
jgi:carboxyl-terminal processing protease